jgi:hypothetical protein
VYRLYLLFTHYPNNNLRFPCSFITCSNDFYLQVYFFVFKLDLESSELNCSWPRVADTMWELVALWNDIRPIRFRQHGKARYLLWVTPFFGAVTFFYINVYTCRSPASSLKEFLRVISARVSSESSTWAKGITELCWLQFSYIGFKLVLSILTVLLPALFSFVL